MITVRVPAKINWYLDIVGRRHDGYHLMEMVNQRIGLYDEIKVEPAKELSLRIEGDIEAPEGEHNLVFRAAKLLQTRYGITSGAKMTLIKNIPMGAGLGGGSADAAAVLKALAALWRVDVTVKSLSTLGLQLGADVPYCLHSYPAIVKGVGEIVEPLPAFPQRWLLLAKPMSGLSTKDVFRQYANWKPHMYRSREMNLQKTVGALQNGETKQLKKHCGNALQEPAILMLPEINDLLEALYLQGAIYAQMTGAGSTVFGVYETEQDAQKALEALKQQAPFAIVAPTI